MPSYNNHHDHVLENIQFLSELCAEHPYSWRWNAVSAYYIAVHLMHAYIASKGSYHPENHENLKKLINPSSMFIDTRIDNSCYASYELLEMNSRKARYHSDFSFREKHFIEAVEYLDSILVFFTDKFSTSLIPSTKIQTTEDKFVKELKYFSIVKSV